MSDQQKITAFSQSSEQNSRESDGRKPDEFGWGSFGRPPEDWPISRVEDLFEIRKDSVDPEELDEEELIRLYSMPAFDDGAEPELTRAGDIGSKKFYVPNHTLLFSKLNISKKRFWLVNNEHNKPAMCSTEYWPLIPSKKLNLEFYYQYFNSDSFIDRPRLSTSSTTNSHQRIKSNLFDKVRLPVPPIEEQRKVATVLHSVDQAIQKTEEIIEKRRKIRSGLQDSLISKYPDKDTQLVQTGPLSLEIPKNWEICNLKDFIKEFVNGATISPDDFSSEGIEVIPKKGVTSSGVLQVDSEKRQHCPVEFAESNSTNMIDSDYILTTLKDLNQEGPSIGRIVDIKPERGYPKGDEYLLAQGVFGLKTNNRINNDYLIELSNSTWYRKYMKSILVGSTQVHIRNPIFLGIKIPVPPIEEQEGISNILRKISKLNELEQNYQKRLERLKKGLMQDLLSGTVRTTDTNIEVPDEIAQHG